MADKMWTYCKVPDDNTFRIKDDDDAKCFLPTRLFQNASGAVDAVVEELHEHLGGANYDADHTIAQKYFLDWVSEPASGRRGFRSYNTDAEVEYLVYEMDVG